MRATYSLKNRNLALVLLDIVGSTAFVQKVGAVTAARVLQRHDQLARSACYRNNGREIDRSDGFLMSFENVQDAIKFALEYNRKVTPKIKLRARVGIHWGQIVEVQQHELFVDAGAKRVELEGISKNIAARTMSLANPSQILLTKDAYLALKNSVKMTLPDTVRTACVGFYKFKGVQMPQQIYAIAEDHALLQPPKGNDKVKRIGGPKYIKKLARDRKIKDYLAAIYKISMFFGGIFGILALYHVLKSKEILLMLGIYEWFSWAPYAISVFEKIIYHIGQAIRK